MNLKDAGIYDLTNIFKGKSSELHSQGGMINSKSRLINIPAYQRPYRWTSKYIRQVFEDYDDNSEEYFLGSAVLVEKVTNDIKDTTIDVIDGQQRITTLYLLNYIRYLLKREFTLEKLKKPYQPKASEYCYQLKECYCDLVGKNHVPFDTIIKRIDDLSDEDIDPNDRVEQLINCYKEQLCISELKGTAEETRKRRLERAHDFFDKEQLCLKYSRSRYDKVLKDVLCSVFIKQKPDTNIYELECLNENVEDTFSKNYLDALKTIFDEIWSRAEMKVDSENANLINKCEKAIELSDSIIKNMSLCIVLTEDENDANKLFEVLNDRALDVEDLELIKNHFYKEYCTNSDDSDEEKDKRITELDEMWVDKIFYGNGPKKNRRISYLAAVYLTCDKDLSNKDDSKLKNAIEKNYTSKRYAKNAEGKEQYSYEKILEDFNIYYAIRIIMDEFDVKENKLSKKSLEAENESKSITYKAIHLLNAMDLTSVIAALVNVIVSCYASTHSMIDSYFEKKFRQYIKALIDDKNNEVEEYKNIHMCAHMFWIAAIKGKDYKQPRNIARRIIEKYGKVGYSSDTIELTASEISKLNKEFDEWLDNWNYNDNKSFSVKILFFNLLLSQRINSTEKSYKAKEDKLRVKSTLSQYNLDAAKLQLDHLEANKILEGTESCYYLPNDKEKRQNDVNGYIGNFMILDAAENNSKNNMPLYKAIDYYSKLEVSWLIQDIKNMMKDEAYFDLDTKVPKEEFFKERSRRLKKYFKELLNRQLDEEEITIIF